MRDGQTDKAIPLYRLFFPEVYKNPGNEGMHRVTHMFI